MRGAKLKIQFDNKVNYLTEKIKEHKNNVQTRQIIIEKYKFDILQHSLFKDFLFLKNY